MHTFDTFVAAVFVCHNPRQEARVRNLRVLGQGRLVGLGLEDVDHDLHLLHVGSGLVGVADADGFHGCCLLVSQLRGDGILDFLGGIGHVHIVGRWAVDPLGRPPEFVGQLQRQARILGSQYLLPSKSIAGGQLEVLVRVVDLSLAVGLVLVKEFAKKEPFVDDLELWELDAHLSSQAHAGLWFVLLDHIMQEGELGVLAVLLRFGTEEFGVNAARHGAKEHKSDTRQG